MHLQISPNVFVLLLTVCYSPVTNFIILLCQIKTTSHTHTHSLLVGGGPL